MIVLGFLLYLPLKFRLCLPAVEIIFYTAETYVIDAEHFSGTYKLVGDTVLRNQKTGKDEAFQVTIPNLKFTSNLELGFAAEGDPSTTTFECEVMRDTDTGAMIQMVKY